MGITNFNVNLLEIKLEKYSEAVEDSSEVLKLEPLNSKGLSHVCICVCLFVNLEVCFHVCSIESHTYIISQRFMVVLF